MSNFSISCLFFFRRVKIDSFNKIIEPKKGITFFLPLTLIKRYKPISYKC